MGNKLKIKTETKFYYNFKLLADNFYEDGLYVAGVLRSCACLSSLHLTRLLLKSISYQALLFFFIQYGLNHYQ